MVVIYVEKMSQLVFKRLHLGYVTVRGIGIILLSILIINNYLLAVFISSVNGIPRTLTSLFFIFKHIKILSKEVSVLITAYKISCGNK